MFLTHANYLKGGDSASWLGWADGYPISFEQTQHQGQPQQTQHHCGAVGGDGLINLDCNHHDGVDYQEFVCSVPAVRM